MAVAERSHPGADELTVVVREVSKRYALLTRRRDRALAFFGRRTGLPFKSALTGVSLEARVGEAVGVIGENGSGKSTLLRLISGLSDADEGTIRVTPPISAILELGLGFHPEFTGRQNALLYGELIGVPARVMRDRLDDILAFAELGEFANMPLRTYSSGMAARLAFAVATHVEPRVLVVDEALAVGDIGFQRKCVERMVRFKDEGRTVLFCSHAMYLVSGFCERAIWLHGGRVRAEGEAQRVVHEYEHFIRHRGTRQAAIGGPPPGTEVRFAWLEDVSIEAGEGVLQLGEPFAVHATVVRQDSELPVQVGVSFIDNDGVVVGMWTTMWDLDGPLRGGARERVSLRFPQCPFARGRFDVTVFLGDEKALQVLDQVLVRGAFHVESPHWQPGLIWAPHRWEVG